MGALAGPSARVIDLRGRRALPGFHDSHTHVLEAGLGLSQVSLKDAPDEEEFGRRLREFDKAAALIEGQSAAALGGGDRRRGARRAGAGRARRRHGPRGPGNPSARRGRRGPGASLPAIPVARPRAKDDRAVALWWPIPTWANLARLRVESCLGHAFVSVGHGN